MARRRGTTPRMQPRKPLPPLLHELLQALKVAREPRLQGVLAALSLAHDGYPCGHAWGFDFVEFQGPVYQPLLGGAGALIVPVFDDGLIVDLAACRVSDRRIATRRGVARALGEDWIDRAVLRRTPLPLFSDPLRWLMAGRQGAVVLNWRQAPFLFDGLDAISCDSPALAARVHAAARQMASPPKPFSPSRCARREKARLVAPL
jgi:hypothetical protein